MYSRCILFFVHDFAFCQSWNVNSVCGSPGNVRHSLCQIRQLLTIVINSTSFLNPVTTGKQRGSTQGQTVGDVSLFMKAQIYSSCSRTFTLKKACTTFLILFAWLDTPRGALQEAAVEKCCALELVNFRIQNIAIAMLVLALTTLCKFLQYI